jgi:hypothetical protein
MRLRLSPCKTLHLPLAPLFGDTQDVIGGLSGLKSLCGIGISRIHIRVGFLGDFAPGFFRVLEIGIAIQAQNIERVHLVPRTAAVAGSRPAIMCGFLIPGCIAPLIGLTQFRFFLGQSLKIVPATILFRSMIFTKHPAVRVIGRFWCGTVTGFVATMAVAKAHLLRLTATAIATPAGESPVIFSGGSNHAADLATAWR